MSPPGLPCYVGAMRYGVCAAILFVGLPGMAHAANAYLAEARRLYRAAQFPEAQAQLELARAVPSDDRAERGEVLELLARCQVAQGQRSEAEATFVEMLKAQPSRRFEKGVSPKILEVYEAARKKAFPANHVALTVLKNSFSSVAGELEDPWERVAWVVLEYRSGDAPWTQTPLKVEQGLWQFAPEALAKGDELSWRLEARSESGASLARLGAPDSPQTVARVASSPVPSAAVQEEVAAPAPKEGSRLRRRVGVGLAVLAVLTGGAAAYLQNASSQSARQARAAEWADDARSAQARATTEATWAVGFISGAAAAGVGATVLLLW